MKTILRRTTPKFAALWGAAALSAFLPSLSPAARAEPPLYAQLLGSGPLVIPNTATATDAGNGNTYVIGGLSGLTYAGGSTYYALMDNQGAAAPFGVTSPQNARFYTLNLSVTTSGVTLNAPITATTLTAPGVTLTNGPWDGEGIAFTPQGTLFISSENDPNAATPNSVSTIREFGLNGAQIGSPVSVPSLFVRDTNSTTGQRGNLGFESLTVSADGLTLYAANEQALFQDGPSSNPFLAVANDPTSYVASSPSPIRILRYTRANSASPFALAGQFGYVVSALPDNAPVGSDRGLVDLLALPGGDFLSVERAFRPGLGNTIQVFQVSLGGATLLGNGPLTGQTFTPASKTLIYDFANSGFSPDNIESLSFGPTLANGNFSVVLTSDNNFGATQTTQIIALQIGAAPEPGTFALLGAGLLGMAGVVLRRRK